ncbi:MAG: hypothetical protein ABR977_04175 [Candidatus Dormibacteria bacterium]|jgi:hypothetical protein
MLNTTGQFLGAPWAAGSGRGCRACGSPIDARDGFGLSEGVCPACRGDEATADLIGHASGPLAGGGRLAVRAVSALGDAASRSLAVLRRAA